MTPFGKRLRHVRTELRSWTQGELAKRSGIHQSQIAHYETGTRTPSLINLTAVVTALGVSADDLMGRELMNHSPTDYTLHNNIDRLSNEQRAAINTVVELMINAANREE